MEKLQDKITNLNSAFNGKIDFGNDLYAYIDESGDEGFDFNKNGVSKWFNVSALIASPNICNDMVDHIKRYRDTRLSQRSLERMSAKELRHSNRKDLFLGLSKYKFLKIHSLFYKPGIDPSDRLVTYPSMYFVGVKNVLERISWCTKQYNKNRAHVTISNRNSIKSEVLKTYLFKTSFKANTNLAYPEKLGNIKLCNFDHISQLLLADYSAFSLRLAFEETGNPPCSEPYYFQWFQQGKLYKSAHNKFGGIWSNGIKIIPSTEEFKEKCDILNEGSRKP
jgi:hypothetical protein